MTFSASRACTKLPRALIARIMSKSSTVVSTNGTLSVRPALLTRMSSRPKRSTASAIVRRATSSSLASPTSTAISSAASLFTSSERSVATIFAPRERSSWAVLRPIPRAAPVTTATLPLRSQFAGICFTEFPPCLTSRAVMNANIRMAFALTMMRLPEYLTYRPHDGVGREVRRNASATRSVQAATAKLGWRFSALAPEELDEVGEFGEADSLRDLSGAQARVSEQPPALQEDPLGDVLLRAQPCCSACGAGDGLRRIAKVSLVIFDTPGRRKPALYFVAEHG